MSEWWRMLFMNYLYPIHVKGYKGKSISKSNEQYKSSCQVGLRAVWKYKYVSTTSQRSSISMTAIYLLDNLYISLVFIVMLKIKYVESDETLYINEEHITNCLQQKWIQHQRLVGKLLINTF